MQNLFSFGYFDGSQASGPQLIGSASGESEERVRQIFQAAMDAAPSVLFIDAIDVIASKREVCLDILCNMKLVLSSCA